MAKDRVLGSEFEKPIEIVEEYRFEPIKGYPMLHWKGKRPFESTQFYPAQLKETYGNEVDGWLNRIYWGDNLQVMSNLLKEFRGKVNLVYIDPPFDSKADYKKKIQLRGQEVINDQNVFEEKQYTDIWTNDEYLQFIYERVILLRELLCENGSFFLHCDWHKVHHLRCILDEVFGATNFENDIVWFHPGGGASGRRFARKHDNLLYYSKRSDAKKFNADEVRVEYETENIRPQTYNFESNKKKRPGFLTGFTYTPNEAGKFAPDVWKDIEYSEADSDVWDEIKALYGPSKQITGYPTQKPEALLDRIIKATTDPGDIIFDCFMGSGTAQAAAMKLGRRFIGADINLGAIHTTTKRLIMAGKAISSGLQQDLSDVDEVPNIIYSGFSVSNVNHYDFFRNELEAKELLIKALEIEALPGNNLFDGNKDGRMVKIMPVGRIATRADLNELINGFDQKTLEKLFKEAPNKAVEKITLVCMGHEPSLAADLKKEMLPYKLDVEVVDILRDKSNLELKRDSEAEVKRTKNKLEIKKFYPMNLLQKLSISKQNVGDWKELVESVMIDFNYDGAVLEPAIVDVPEGNQLVKGEYEIPAGAGTIRVKITDLLSESLEVTVNGSN